MVWPVWVVQAIIAVAVIIVGELLRPKPKIEDPKPSALGDFNFPTATEGRVIPVVWGTVKIAGPNVVWYGDLKTVAIRKKQKTGLWSSKMVTIGYKYYLGIQHALCFGKIDEFIGMILDDRAVTFSSKEVTTDTTLCTMHLPTLFGKEDQEGGVAGIVRVYHGTFSQTPNAYLEEVIGEPLPAYRPVSQVVFERCYLGNSGRMPKPEFILRRTPNPLGLAAGKFNINGDANPANMIYEIMTDRVWGMGIPASLIDTAAFVAVGDTLAAEGFGLSMVVDNEQGGENLLSEIVRHIDGVVYNDFVTGKFKIALVRDDYDENTLSVYDESKIVKGSLEFSRASWEDTQNTVKIKYVDREQNYTQRVVQHQDIANISVRNGQIEAEEYDFTGVSNPTLANKIAARVLQTVASPLSRVNFSANRHAGSLRPGDVFKLSWSELGISSVVYRVTEVEYGTLDNPEIRISAIEDIFSVSTVAYETPGQSGWTNPIGTPVDLSPVRLWEIPYGLQAFTGRYVAALAAQTQGQEIGYETWVDTAGGTSYVQVPVESDFTATGTLAAAYDPAPYDAVGFTVAGIGDADDLDLSDILLLIDDELFHATSGSVNVDNSVTFSGVTRAIMDTVPKPHASGARVWVVSSGFTSVTGVDTLPSDTTVKVKLLPYVSQQTLPLASASVRSLTTYSRETRPYPPGRVRFSDAVVSGSAAPSALAGTVTLQWEHRNRLVQSGPVSLDAIGIEPEADTRYAIRIYRVDTNAMLVSKTGINAKVAAFNLNYLGAVRVELASSVGVLESYFYREFSFNYDPAGSITNAITADTSADVYVLDGGAP